MPSLQIKNFFFYAETGEQSLLMFLVLFSKSGLKSKDYREFGKVCL